MPTSAPLVRLVVEAPSIKWKGPQDAQFAIIWKDDVIAETRPTEAVAR